MIRDGIVNPNITSREKINELIQLKLLNHDHEYHYIDF